MLWAAGNQASPLVGSLRSPLDRAGRALVEPDLSIPGYPEVFVVGDAAAAPLLDGHSRSKAPASTFVPAVAAAANQMGAHAAKMITLTLAGRPRRSFRYRDRGALAVIGRGRAIAALGRLRIAGHAAFFTWLFVHLAYLAGFRNRVSVMLEWAYAYFTYRPGARVLGEGDRLRPSAARVTTDQRRAS